MSSRIMQKMRIIPKKFLKILICGKTIVKDLMDTKQLPEERMIQIKKKI